MDTLTIGEVGYLIEKRVELDKQHYRLISDAVSVGYHNVKSKKQVKLFDDKKPNQPKPRVGSIESEKKQADLEYLRNMRTQHTP